MFQGRKCLLFCVLLGFASPSFASHVEAEFVPGQYLVKLRKGAVLKSQQIESFKQKFRAESVSVVSAPSHIILVQKSILERPSHVQKELSLFTEVEYVEPNQIITLRKTPNDPELSELWGLVNTGKSGTKGMDIGAEAAWDISTGDKKVVVAVIDTGVDYTQPDLADNMWINSAELNGQPGVDDDNNGFIDDVYGWDFGNMDNDPLDDHGHGTHCSGTIGAKGNDGFGLVGVSWDVSIMALKFLTRSGSGTLAGAVAAIDYATQMGADIMSNSWGAYSTSKALEEAVQRADDAGILFVAAAGNESRNGDLQPLYPAGYREPNVISVAASNSSGGLAYFSNYGEQSVHLAAPGVDILSVTPKGYESWSGTSMATPHVAGVAALLFAHNSALTHLEVKDRILNAVRPLPALKGKTITGGMLNAHFALKNQKYQP